MLGVLNAARPIVRACGDTNSDAGFRCTPRTTAVALSIAVVTFAVLLVATWGAWGAIYVVLPKRLRNRLINRYLHRLEHKHRRPGARD